MKSDHSSKFGKSHNPAPGIPLFLKIFLIILVSSIYSNSDAVSQDITPFQQGWPITTHGGADPTLAIGDINGDGELEVVFGDRNGMVYVIRSDGTPLPGWPKAFPGEIFSDRASLADVDEDGTLEIFIASGKKVYILNWQGEVLDGWPQPPPELLGFGAFIGGPAVADLDNDGNLNVVITSTNGRVFVWSTTGKLSSGWPQNLPVLRNHPPGSGSGPALGDLDQDGNLEIVINSIGSVHVLRHDGLPFGGSWPVVMEEGRNVGGSPVLGDLLGNGDLEVIIGTSIGRDGLGRVFAFGSHGNVLSGWPQVVAFNVNGGVALGDLDGDKKLEVVAATIDDHESIYVWKGEDGTLLPGWPQGTPEHLAVFNPSPSLGDIDGDGLVDIVTVGLTGHLFNFGTALFAWHLDGTLITPEPLIFPSRINSRSTPTLVDLDQDGDIEIGFGTENSSNQFSPGEVFFLDFPGTFDPSTLEWPTLSHDVARTGRYRPLVQNIQFPATLAPPVIHLRNPPPFLTTSVRIPEEFPEASIFFWIMKAGGKNILPIRALEPRSPRAFGGQVQVFRFDGNQVAEALRTRFPSLEAPRDANLRLTSSTRHGKRLIGVARIQIIP